MPWPAACGPLYDRDGTVPGPGDVSVPVLMGAKEGPLRALLSVEVASGQAGLALARLAVLALGALVRLAGAFFAAGFWLALKRARASW